MVSIGLTLVKIFIPVFLVFKNEIFVDGGLTLEILPDLVCVNLPIGQISPDSSHIKFYLWIKRPNGTITLSDLQYEDNSQLKEIFDNFKSYPNVYVDVYFHDVGSNGKADWILENKDYFLNGWPTSPEVIISVDYANIAKTKISAIAHMEMITDKASKLFTWMKKTLSSKTLLFEIIGHGMGADIAAGTFQKTLNVIPERYIALDPEMVKNYVLNINCKVPEISKELANLVIVLHCSTCYISPEIEACRSSSSATLGHVDYFPNGGALQPGCKMDDQDCKRKIAAEIFVQVNKKYIFQYTYYSAKKCDNFEKFNIGDCASYLSNIDFLFDTNIEDGRYYFNTTKEAPYLFNEN